MSHIRTWLRDRWVNERAGTEAGMKLRLSEPAVAGMYLDAAGGDVKRAIAMVPANEGGMFWAAVRLHLVECAREEERGSEQARG